ncbi:hypothetical protein [Treponema sp. R6D11]
MPENFNTVANLPEMTDELGAEDILYMIDRRFPNGGRDKKIKAVKLIQDLMKLMGPLQPGDGNGQIDSRLLSYWCPRPLTLEFADLPHGYSTHYRLNYITDIPSGVHPEYIAIPEDFKISSQYPPGEYCNIALVFPFKFDSSTGISRYLRGFFLPRSLMNMLKDKNSRIIICLQRDNGDIMVLYSKLMNKYRVDGTFWQNWRSPSSMEDGYLSLQAYEEDAIRAGYGLNHIIYDPFGEVDSEGTHELKKCRAGYVDDPLRGLNDSKLQNITMPGRNFPIWTYEDRFQNFNTQSIIAQGWFTPISPKPSILAENVMFDGDFGGITNLGMLNTTEVILLLRAKIRISIASSFSPSLNIVEQVGTCSGPLASSRGWWVPLHVITYGNLGVGAIQNNLRLQRIVGSNSVMLVGGLTLGSGGSSLNSPVELTGMLDLLTPSSVSS